MRSPCDDPASATRLHYVNHLSSSVIDAIGGTPLVELRRLCQNLDGLILAKLEYLNPGLSKKDRIAREIIELAEKEGTLNSGQTVVELTSGNTGTGLAMVCSVKGYPFVAVMSRGNSPERSMMMSALGAEVVLVDQAGDSAPGIVSGADLELVEHEAKRIVAERGAFRADQFRNRASFQAHYLHTGPEILRQCGGKFNAFCDFVGTGGTFAGCTACFKEFDPGIRCYVVEPTGCAVLAGGAVNNPNHRIQGGGYSIANLPLLQHASANGYVNVTDGQAIEAARHLAAEEGIFAGFSSGANVSAAIQLLRGPVKGGTLVTIINDSGLKYLSTDLWRS